MLEVCGYGCIFKSNLVKQVIKLAKQFFFFQIGLCRCLLFCDWLLTLLLWVSFVLLFDLVYHCCNDAANRCRFSFHLIHCAVEIFEIPFSWLIIHAYHRRSFDLRLNTRRSRWTLVIILLGACRPRSHCFYWLLHLFLTACSCECCCCFLCS